MKDDMQVGGETRIARTPEERAASLILEIRSGKYTPLYEKLLATLFRDQAEAYSKRIPAPDPIPGERRIIKTQAEIIEEMVPPEMTHRMNCSAWKDMHGYDVNGEDCTCGLRWRIEIGTLQTLKAAWEKRAYEAEAEISSLQAQLSQSRGEGFSA